MMSTDPRAQTLKPPGLQSVKEVLPEYQSGPSWIGIGGPAMARHDHRLALR